MKEASELKKLLLNIDGKGYKAYKSIRGTYSFENFDLYIDYVQGDPYASPSKIRVRVPQKKAKFPVEYFKTKERKIALEDLITRKVYKQIGKRVKMNRGSGKSGIISIQRCGQEVLERTSVRVNSGFIEARIAVGLPARGRRVMGRQATAMFFDELPQVVENSLFLSSLEESKVKARVELFEDQEHLRRKLNQLNLVAFVKNGSILPRKSGVSDTPMEKSGAVPFISPKSLEVAVELPNSGKITGMGVPKGVTLIVGGGYHGKTTLLSALEKGVYNHVSGDGREFVITVPDAVKIRAEDGRNVEKVDISPFIQNVPSKDNTSSFISQDASGSTSQAANIIESLEIGTHLLLLDEDTSATNFMIRDERMQTLVAKEKEPITPFLDRAELLRDRMDVSSVIVMGGSGDYFDIADTVIMMDEYRPHDVTEKAKGIAKEKPTRRAKEGGEEFGKITHRIPLAESFRGRSGKRIKIKSRGKNLILYAKQPIDLSYVEQIVDSTQTNSIGRIIYYIYKNYINDAYTLKELVSKVLEDIEEKGLEVLSPFSGHPGEYSLPRPQEIAAAINRMRSLEVKQKERVKIIMED